jgi:putative membrane protein
MRIALNVLCALIALEHVWFLVLEMFFWRKPLGLKTFGMTQDVADSSAVLAGNQGLYNGFLAAGLVWGLLATEPFAAPVKLFFLACVLAAGVYGGATAKRSILFIQALPAVVGLALLWFGRD